MDHYTIYAIEYFRRQAPSGELFLRCPEQKLMPMSYYIWAITGPNGPVVVDTGYKKETAIARGRDLTISIEQALKVIGIDPGEVPHVIATHFHWDHLGSLDLFPSATFYAQEKEMAFWTGRYASFPIFLEVIEAKDITDVVNLNLGGRLVLIDGSMEILPGIKMHRVGGHTPGMQIVEVETSQGTAVIASDAVKMYRNLAENIPDPFLNSIPEMLDGYAVVRELASEESLIFAGHDPEVLDRFKPAGKGAVVLE